MAELEERGHTAEAVPGERLQYDVFAGDRLVFSRDEEGRWPTADDVVARL